MSIDGELLGIAKQFPSTGSAYRPYADEYRELAEQRLAFAAAAWRIEAKTTWVALALKWQRLAEKAEKLAKQQPQERVMVSFVFSRRAICWHLRSDCKRIAEQLTTIGKFSQGSAHDQIGTSLPRVPTIPLCLRPQGRT